MHNKSGNLAIKRHVTLTKLVIINNLYLIKIKYDEDFGNSIR